MASKERRGLPVGFDLNIPEPDPSKPVQLGDYLDEVDADLPRTPTPPARSRRPEQKIVQMPRPAERGEDEAPPAPPEQPKAEEPKPTPRRRRKLTGPARKQINATPETLKMIEELLDHVQTYSVQKDAKASEVFHALVLALYEAREFLDLSEVPSRGRWGTPTAKAFPVSLKNAFQEAIAVASKRNRR